MGWAFLGVLMIMFGGVNLMSEQASFLSWIFMGLGFVLLVAKLSGPSKRKHYGKGATGAAIHSQTQGSYSSDYSDSSGGDGGGGGD